MKALRIFILLLLGILFFVIVVYPFTFNVSQYRTQNPRITAMMRYRVRQWEKKGKKLTISYRFVPLSKISPYLIKAVLIAEDDKFYQHEGFDLEGLKKALEKDLKKKKFKYGGSTISQQLAKNLFLSPRKSLIRKFQEAVLTIRIEKILTKKRILELYLNIAEWGPGIFGAEASANYYFGKSANDLTPWESALLAAVLPRPLKCSPSNPSPYIQKRAEKILYIMKKRGIISEEYSQVEREAEEIKKSPQQDSMFNADSSFDQNSITLTDSIKQEE
ncbi:MAG: monofunctional biosynthetic peptidoglycan transglycosylase [bacterium]|nr:monofunctional biosynthetic peptidoglycan transglycosylase [bacterium]